MENYLSSSDPHQWVGLGGGAGSWGILERLGDLAIGYRCVGGHGGVWNDLGIWLSGIGVGGREEEEIKQPHLEGWGKMIPLGALSLFSLLANH